MLAQRQGEGTLQEKKEATTPFEYDLIKSLSFKFNIIILIINIFL